MYMSTMLLFNWAIPSPEFFVVKPTGIAGGC